MKMAVVSDDGLIISQHFGRAQYYAVATVEDNRIASIEMREKIGHAVFGQEDHSASSDPRGHGFDASAQSRHARMLNTVSDCQVLIARGILAPHASAGVGNRCTRVHWRCSYRPRCDRYLHDH
jgi:hypothetical protein